MSLLSSAHAYIFIFMLNVTALAQLNTALHLYTFVTGTNVINID